MKSRSRVLLRAQP